jgi:hypothetical protein
MNITLVNNRAGEEANVKNVKPFKESKCQAI